MKQTAVDVYGQKSRDLIHLYVNGDIDVRELLIRNHNIYYEVKQMEKEQIIDAYYQCGKDNFEHIKVINRSAVDYYNETYGSKGSGVLNEEGGAVSSGSGAVTSSQTEISDEEIEKAASKYNSSGFNGNAVGSFMVGAIWYREQLKQRQ